MSTPVQTQQQQQQQQQASTPTGQSSTGPPPVPPTKPILSSPGAYMANFTSSTTTPTAGIHSVNKSHEKPAIAARPIPPPTLPKYSSSFSKIDRDRNEFSTGSKIDRAEREKVCKCFNKKKYYTCKWKSFVMFSYIVVLGWEPCIFDLFLLNIHLFISVSFLSCPMLLLFLLLLFFLSSIAF